MLKVTRLLPEKTKSDIFIELSFEMRQKSRFKATLSDNTAAGIFLPRGNILRHGDCLLAEDGRIIVVHAEAEPVSAVYSNNTLLLAKACYHLGNRHVALQIEKNRICYLHDHVLDDMLCGLGLQVTQELAAFEPENGAYAQTDHHHTHQSHHHD